MDLGSLLPVLPSADVAPLTKPQQDAFLARIARGASMSSACSALGVSVSAVLATIERDASFGDQLDVIGQLLSQNVVAALYKAAMEGNVTAQTFFLKHHPPLEWQAGSDESTDRQTRNN